MSSNSTLTQRLKRLLSREPLPSDWSDEVMSQPANRNLLVGLGNPGRDYRANRHNLGFMAADRLAARHGIELTRTQSRAIVGSGRIGGLPAIIAKPQTFMNRSGEAVGALMNYYRIEPGSLLVVYDELDLPFGAIRLREMGGAGGHNGMKSIIQHVGNDFARLRLGIGRPPGRMEPAAFVLQDFKGDEVEVANEMLETAVDTIETYLSEGIDVAMSRYNGTTVGGQAPQS